MKIFSYLTVLLGWWILAFVFTFCEASRCGDYLFLSDLVSGIVLIVFGLLSLSAYRLIAAGAVFLIGIWLQAAPLVLWAPSAMVYLNDTVIGALAFVFSFKMVNREKRSADLPKGWSYNPSLWRHRIPTIALALLCWSFARYMAAYQLGYISHIWDPFFPEGTLRVITSDISRSFPVSDAGLGALCYAFEVLLGCQGDRFRFATMPWVVFSFAFLVIPVGIVSIILIILQPIMVGAWCSWCLATAFCMLWMIALTAAECVASFQFLKERKKSFWKVFWQGAGTRGTESKGQSFGRSLRHAWGITIPWNLALSALLGLSLMLVPSVFNILGKGATNDYIAGPIIFAVSVISMAEVFRFFRYCLIVLGAWTILIPLIFATHSSVTILYHLIVGALLFLFALRKGPIHERYGSWERFI